MNPVVVSALLVAGPLAVWFAVFGLVLLATRPETPPAAPATEDLGEEPPAVASFLVNHWEITEDAAESTLLDLGARHFLEFRQPGNDPMQTTVHVKQPNPAGLRPYEQRVFDRVAGAVGRRRDPVDGADVPRRRRRRAPGRNGSPPTWSPRPAPGACPSGASARAVVSALGIARGRRGHARGRRRRLLHHARAHPEASRRHVPDRALRRARHRSCTLAGIAGRGWGERDTAAGRAAASRWLGVRAWLRGHESFADLPPAAVAVWDRYLSYGAAVGATRVSSAVIDLGMGNRRNVWSSFGGTWHRVRVRYPRFWPRYGKTAPKLILKAVILGVVGFIAAAVVVPRRRRRLLHLADARQPLVRLRLADQVGRHHLPVSGCWRSASTRSSARSSTWPRPSPSPAKSSGASAGAPKARTTPRCRGSTIWPSTTVPADTIRAWGLPSRCRATAATATP